MFEWVLDNASAYFLSATCESDELLITKEPVHRFYIALSHNFT